MSTRVIWAASTAVLASGLGLRISPAVRRDSLDGFAIGALLSGACLLLASSPRRPGRSLFTRRRRRPAPRHAAPPPGFTGRVANLLPGREMAPGQRR